MYQDIGGECVPGRGGGGGSGECTYCSGELASRRPLEGVSLPAGVGTARDLLRSTRRRPQT